jgi:Beta-ketoacyl synthase, N-terminal domain
MKLTLSTDSTGYFGIARWRAWAPGITHMDDWWAWLKSELPAPPEEQLDLSFLPSLLRRRLDRFGRMALYTAWPCVEGIGTVQHIFASRHGSLNRTVELLTALANEETLSPTQFTLSVHNSVAGLFAIGRGDRSAATAMAAGPDTLGLSILEGANMIAEGSKYVLVTYADDSVPEIYRKHITGRARLPFTVSLLLTSAPESALCCRLEHQAKPLAKSQSTESALIRFLLKDVSQVVLGTHQTWQLERASVA